MTAGNGGMQGKDELCEGGEEKKRKTSSEEEELCWVLKTSGVTRFVTRVGKPCHKPCK